MVDLGAGARAQARAGAGGDPARGEERRCVVFEAGVGVPVVAGARLSGPAVFGFWSDRQDQEGEPRDRGVPLLPRRVPDSDSLLAAYTGALVGQTDTIPLRIARAELRALL